MPGRLQICWQCEPFVVAFVAIVAVFRHSRLLSFRFSRAGKEKGPLVEATLGEIFSIFNDGRLIWRPRIR
jgi:hypothetical protein